MYEYNLSQVNLFLKNRNNAHIRNGYRKLIFIKRFIPCYKRYRNEL
jgi:hypothetical protein